MNSKDGVPRRAILVMTAILVSVILGAQASVRMAPEHQIFGPGTPLVPFTTAIAKNTANKQDNATGNKKQVNQTIGKPSIVKNTAKNNQVYAVVNNRVVHASGILDSSATWTSDKVYYVDNVQIPTGVILTVQPGTVIRVEGAKGFVINGGGLITQGTDDNPVTITSSADIVGVPGDYDTAVTVLAGRASLGGTTISNATTGLTVVSGSATVQGSIKNTITYGITACNWSDMQCAVDASQADITTLSGGEACGRVLLSTAAKSGALFAPNCDGTASPQQNLDRSIAQFMQSLAARNDACGAGDSAACDSLQTPLACVADGLRTLSGSVAFVLPDVVGSDDVLAFTSRALAAANSYTVQQVTGNSTSIVISSVLTSVTDNFNQIKNTYDTCASS